MALADLEGSATLVAVMVIDCPVLITDGAVYNPFDKFPIEGVMDHVTEVFTLPVTLAVNCLLCEAERFAFEGLRLMVTPTLPLAGAS